MRVLSAFLLIFLISDVCGRKKKWLKHPNVVVFKKNAGKVKEIPTEEFTEEKSHHHHHHNGKHNDARKSIKHRHRLNFGKTDALPYSSPFSRPYNFNMYTDGPFGWGPARRRRNIDSYNTFKRSLYQPSYGNQQYQQQAYQPAAYVQSPRQPYNYQAAQSRDTLSHASSTYPQQSLAKPLQRKAPQVQQPQERTWVDKMGVTWTTRKVNDYKWGEREPGIMMDEYAGGPFGFDDVKRSHIQRAEWQRRSGIPGTKISPRSWVDKFGVRWTNQKVNDYKWGEREPGVTMDEYNGGPFGWSDVKRSKIYFPNRPRK
ncbi:uncharacterized protein LOC114518330 [Dendronephthya gigantea]|uniref:uncharacterized protein LOC114518330 n=1 Tax=Dendronephthya gigantea TaxID=151771 RepID=UPI00106C4D04|nr:uncharacterized protein LOC114518330 [Dendronephthya gigantea]